MNSKRLEQANRLKAVAGKIVDLIADSKQIAARDLLFKGRTTKPHELAMLSMLVCGAALDRKLDYKIEYFIYEVVPYEK